MGIKKCAVKGCNNWNSNTNISFHKFPLDPILKEKWIKATGVEIGYICAEHFEKEMYCLSEVERERLRLKKCAVPTVFNDKHLNKSSSILLQTQHLGDIETLYTVDKTENISIRNGVSSPHLLAMAKSFKTSNNISGSELCSAKKSLFSISNINNDFPEPYNIDEIQLTPRTKRLRKSLCGLPKIGRPKNNNPETQIKELKTKLQKIECINKQLRNDNQKAKEENKKLENELIEVQHKSDSRAKSIASVLSNFFSPGQVKAIHMGPDWKKKIRWSSEDISSAISLQSVSPKAYRYLSKKLNFPLPSISTLCRRTQVMTLRPGFIDDVFSVMKGKSENMTDLEKITIISFDEMYLHNRIEYEPQEQRILGPHNNVQVMCARGLFSQWKQPIFFDFDCDMSVTILNNAIKKLHDVGFLVVAFVSDMGPKNRGLHKKLDITPTKPYFENPSIPGEKVFCFADTPHLLKLIRNHLLDNDLILADGQVVNRKPLDKLVEIQTAQLKPGWKLSKTLLDVKGSERQNVKAAARVLSANTAKAILFVGDNQLFNGTGAENCYKITSDFIQMVNDWFDIHNSNNQFGPHPAFGKDLDKQIDLLKKMSSIIENLRVNNHCSMLPFQHGILISNSSLIQLLPYLQDRFNGITYILTRRLNQDILENLFSYLRAMGHSFDHPGPLEFIYRLKKYILGKHSSAVFSLHKNVEDDVMTNNLSTELLENKNISNENNANEAEKDIILTQSIFDAILDGNDLIFDEDEFDFEIKNMNENINNDIISMAGLEYITGFVAHHFRAKYPHLMSNGDMNSSSWIAYASRGNLTVPSNKLMDVAKVMEHFFIQFHGEYFSKDISIIRKIADKVINYYKGDLPVPEKVLLYLIRTRTFILVRAINAEHKQKYDIMKKNKKKLNKVINIIPKLQASSSNQVIFIPPTNNLIIHKSKK